jgi:kynurenine formamidase
MFIRRSFKNLRAIGIDSISVGSHRHPNEAMETHRLLLGKESLASPPVMIIEDLNLGAIKGPAKRLFAIPLFLQGVDGMPCTVFVEV